MGKHMNTQQEEMLIGFMEKNPQLAKGFVKGDRVEIEKLWQTLSENLNSVGPPKKDSSGWKKVWSERKSNVKKKLATNKKESRATGGGPNNQIFISSRDETVARLCGLFFSVEGIEGCEPLGPPAVTETVFSETENESQDSPVVIDQSRKRKLPSLQENLKKFMINEENTNEEISKNLLEISNFLKASIEVSKNLESTIKSVCISLDKIGNGIVEQSIAIKNQTQAIVDQTKENQRHNAQIEKLLYEKNLLKRQILEIQKNQLDVFTIN